MCSFGKLSQLANTQWSILRWMRFYLENSLIKEFQPKYNINLKDDKSYPYIKITQERYPKVFPIRNLVKDGSEYFGPYASVRIMHTVLDLCQKLYPTRNCNLKMTPTGIAEGKYQVCLEFHIGNCKGPCVGNQSELAYQESIQHIRHISERDIWARSKHTLNSSMHEAAENP